MKINSVLYAINDVDGDIIKSAEPGRKRRIMRIRFQIAAAVLLMAALTFVFVFIGAKNHDVPADVAAHVYLDINPSFTLDMSSDGKIFAVSAENEDAKKVFDKTGDFSPDKEIKLDALLDKIMECGYLSEEKDTLLCSVDCEDSGLSDKIQSQLKEESSGYLSKKLPSGHAIVLDFYGNKHADKIAAKHGISKSKATFLIRLIGKKAEYTEEMLASLDVTTLRKLCEEHGVSTDYAVILSAQDANETAYAAMKDVLGDEPIGSIIFGNVNKGEQNCWRVAVHGKNSLAVFDINVLTGEIEEEKHASYLDRVNLYDAAVKGAGYNEKDITHYEYSKSEEWIAFYVFTDQIKEDECDYLEKDIDLSWFTDCYVKIHPLNGEFLKVRVNGFTGEVISVKAENYTYSIDTLDAVIIAMDDAGISYDLPRFPKSCKIIEGVCTLRFEYEDSLYEYKIDAYTKEIISKQVTKK